MTDLTTLSQNLPAHVRVQNESDLAEFQTGIQSGLDIAFLSIRGKEFRFRYQGNETSTRSRQLDVVVVASRPGISKRWYDKAYEPGSIEGPACFALDGAIPSDLSPNKQADKCSICPRNQFGSKVTPSGKPGKECGDYKRFVVLPVLDGKLELTPVVLDLPWTSLKKARDDRSDNQFWQEYGGALYRHQIAPYAVITRLEFTDREFPQVCFAFDRALDEAEAKQVLPFREDETVQQALSTELVEPAGAITEAKPEPEPEPAKADTSAVSNLLKGQAPEPKPEKAAEPEPAKPTAPDSGIIDQIRASLSKLER